MTHRCLDLLTEPLALRGLRASAMAGLVALAGCGGADSVIAGPDGPEAAQARASRPVRPSRPVAPAGEAPPVEETTPTAPPPDGGATAPCALPSLPAKPADAADVRKFGANPDDGQDDAAAIQAALNALQPGQWLVFAAGTYQQGKRLVVRTPGVVLWSEGATLHATNPLDQAVMLAADGASIYNFTLTAVTGSRLHAPWQSRIAVFDRVDRATHLRGNVIRGNRVVNAGAPGTATANSASSAGIFVFRADGFLVAGNEVKRSLSDGIHVTAGSRNGRVLANTVRETGDDMIAMVSYLKSGNWQTETAQTMAATFAERRDLQLVRNVLVAGNDVEGQYWGRGISVVGGADITLRDNRIARTTLAAGILLAREASYVTWGVSNVLVQRNAISQVQTTAPAYVPAGWPGSVSRTGHAGLEIHAFAFDDERLYPALMSALSVQDVRIEHSSVADAAVNGVRIGEGSGTFSTLTAQRDDGSTTSRRYGGGDVGRISLSRIALSGTGSKPLAIKNQPTETFNVHCDSLTNQGAPLTDAACSGAAPAVSGSSMVCGG
jgi:Pectate lyase superfamily protein